MPFRGFRGQPPSSVVWCHGGAMTARQTSIGPARQPIPVAGDRQVPILGGPVRPQPDLATESFGGAVWEPFDHDAVDDEEVYRIEASRFLPLADGQLDVLGFAG